MQFMTSGFLKHSLMTIGFGILCGATSSLAQESSCVLVQKLAMNLGCMGTVAGVDAQKSHTDDLITNTFGPSDCATAKKLEEDKASQKRDCQAWLSDQKKELGVRYVTGSCKNSCTPCPETMNRCSTLGEVRYRLDNRK